MPRKRTQFSRQSATAKRLRFLRSNETADENMYRLATQQVINEQNRVRETGVEHSQRLASQHSRTLASYKRSHRLAQQNARSTINRTRSQNNVLNFAFAYDCNLDYFVLNDVDIGRMDKICNKCQAKKWEAEAPGLCCSGGKVNIPKVPEPTSVLKELISGSHPSSKHFLNESRQYKTLFSNDLIWCQRNLRGELYAHF